MVRGCRGPSMKVEGRVEGSPLAWVRRGRCDGRRGKLRGGVLGGEQRARGKSLGWVWLGRLGLSGLEPHSASCLWRFGVA